MKDFGVTFFNQYRFERQDLDGKICERAGLGEKLEFEIRQPKPLLNL